MYAGADWLQKSRYAKGRTLSPFGRTVADVIGQVWQGIYHVEKEVTANYKLLPDRWFDGADYIRLTFHEGAGFASYDGCRLTALYLCATAAGIDVEISGASGDTIAIAFQPRQRDIESYTGNPTYKPDTMTTTYCDRELRYNYDGTVLKFAEGRYRGSIPHDCLGRLLQDAHASCIRVQVCAHCRGFMKIWFNQRQREGKFMYARHPTWEDAVEKLKILWQPLASGQLPAIF